MTRPLATLTLALLLAAAPAAQAQDAPPAGTLAACLAAAANIKTPGQPGDFAKVEYLNPSAEGMPTFEIELVDADGQEWEFMCDARSAQIYEIEQEAASPSDRRFNAEVSEEAARQTVLDLYGGTIGEVEYEIESDGGSSYEIDVDAGGTEWKVEVDAATGAIVEVHVEKWEIGVEPDERP
jgi:uncharacterized membrane protein YkoI